MQKEQKQTDPFASFKICIWLTEALWWFVWVLQSDLFAVYRVKELNGVSKGVSAANGTNLEFSVEEGNYSEEVSE